MIPFFKSSDEARNYALYSINGTLWLILGMLAYGFMDGGFVSLFCVAMGLVGKLGAFFRYFR